MLIIGVLLIGMADTSLQSSFKNQFHFLPPKEKDLVIKAALAAGFLVADGHQYKNPRTSSNIQLLNNKFHQI